MIGIANYIIHENTSTLTPVCYLQDLFVDPEIRARGIGRTLIDWLIAEMKTNGPGFIGILEKIIIVHALFMIVILRIVVFLNIILLMNALN